jgi:hypothetical protein
MDDCLTYSRQLEPFHARVVNVSSSKRMIASSILVTEPFHARLVKADMQVVVARVPADAKDAELSEYRSD